MLMLGAELSLTVPIVNTMAFLFTVLGEWLVDGKIISASKSSGSGSLVCESTNANMFNQTQA